MLYENDVLRNFANFTGKYLCQSLACNFFKKEALAQVFSCEFSEFSKNTYRKPLDDCFRITIILESKVKRR